MIDETEKTIAKIGREAIRHKQRIGINRGIRASTLARVEAKIEQWAQREGGKVAEHVAATTIGVGVETQHRPSVSRTCAEHWAAVLRQSFLKTFEEFELDGLFETGDGFQRQIETIEKTLKNIVEMDNLEKARTTLEKHIARLTNRPKHYKERWRTRVRDLKNKSKLTAQTWNALQWSPAWLAREAFSTLDAKTLERKRERLISALVAEDRAQSGDEPREWNTDTSEKRLKRTLKHWKWASCTPPLTVVGNLTTLGEQPVRDSEWAGAIMSERDARMDNHFNRETWIRNTGVAERGIEAHCRIMALKTFEELARKKNKVTAIALDEMDERWRTMHRQNAKAPRLEREGWTFDVAWYCEHDGPTRVLATGTISAKKAGDEMAGWEGRYIDVTKTGNAYAYLSGKARVSATSEKWRFGKEMEEMVQTMIAQ